MRFITNLRSLYSVPDVRFQENPSSGSQRGIEDMACSSCNVLVIR